jgi:hypothetical protein
MEGPVIPAMYPVRYMVMDTHTYFGEMPFLFSSFGTLF